MVETKPIKTEEGSDKKSPETVSTSENTTRTSKSPVNESSSTGANKSSNNPAENSGSKAAASTSASSPVPPTEPSPPPRASSVPPTSLQQPPTSATSTPRQHPMPILTNPPTSNPNNRPPSTTSVLSATSANAARTTTTSRRGGRTRCRSPPAMGSRPGSSLGNTAGGGDYGAGGGSGGDPDTPYGPPPESPYNNSSNNNSNVDRRDGPGPAPPAPPSPANPSAAAAAAAAAAKSLSNSSSRNPPPSSWGYNDGPETGSTSSRDYGSRRHREAPSARYHHHPPSSSSSSRHPHHHPHHAHPGDYHPSSSYQRSSWPEDDGGPPPPRRGRDYGPPPPPSQSIHRRQHGDEHYGSSREGYPYSYSSGRGRSERYPPPPPHYDEDFDRRYPSDHHHHSHHGPPSRGPPYGGSERMTRRGPPPTHDRSISPHPPPYGGGPPDRHRHSGRRGGDGRDPYAYTGPPSGMGPLADGGVPPSDPSANSPTPGSSRAEAGAPSSVKRTTMVIGTATPIHIPQASDPASKSSSSSSRRGGGTPASVFRGRPGSDAPPPPRSGSGAEKRDDDSPQKILLSLRTPTTSFEEKPPATVKASNSGSRRSPAGSQDPALPLSPEEPPQIRNSNHQNSNDATLFFEPQRSPKSQSGPPQPTSSIEMAPSFSLFNQSFDSFGDTAQYFNVGGPLDAALQSTSFGAGPTGSVDIDKGDQLQLHPSMSGGNFAQQLLGGSGSGALTFGMSPNNSFGNGPPSRTSNITMLGGQDGRSASPTQVLGMYRSYSGSGSPRPKIEPLDDSHLRMSGGGSFAAPSIGHSYTRSFGGDGMPPGGHYRNNSMGPGAPEGPDGPPRFYHLLRNNRGAFKECTFLLPGLKQALLESPLADTTKSGSRLDDTAKGHGRDRSNAVPDHSSSTKLGYGEPNPQDVAIAVRRIASAVCAFGGTIMGDRASLAQQKANSQSIFREKDGTATVTPNSSSSSPPGSRNRNKAKYDEQLPSRYYENDNRLSWEFEENPPVDDVEEEEEHSKNGEGGDGSKSNHGVNGETGSRQTGDGDEEDVDGDGDGSKANASNSGGDQPKMRYRCKLCGQPKQNHTCPYQQSLARSIGVMVYPAVNAFTSAEPGILAPALSEMNNFVLSDCQSVSSAETSPSRPTPDRMRRLNQTLPTNTNQVTPESLRGAARGSNSPISAMSTGSVTPQRRTPGSSSRKVRGHGMSQRFMGSPPGSSPRKKRTHSQMGGSEDQGDLLFVESMELKPEQFRIVTQSKATSSPDAFTYPALPLPYAQRKRLSDNLFSLSKEVPQLTDECAAVLREAREKDLWDLAVAELMTQVVVVVHCQDGDARLDGLRRYLLTLGIAC